MTYSLGPSQIKFLESYKVGRVNLACGSVRSGKSEVANAAFHYFLVKEAIPKIPVLITAKSGRAIEQNVISPFLRFVEREGAASAYQVYHQPLRVVFTPKEIEIFCVGANDEGAEARIRGSTVQGWLGDEVTLYPERFFERCNASLSHAPRTAFLTCNPDRHTHWLKQKYIGQGLLEYHQFRLTDNPSLAPEYIDMIKKVYTGVQYTRFIEGEWGGGEDDLVVPEFQEAKEKIVYEHERPEFYHPMMALDVGWRDFTVALFGYYDFLAAKIVIEDEVVIKKQMNTEQLARMIREMESDLWGREAEVRYTDVDLRLIEDMAVLHNINLIPTRKDDKDAQINNLRILVKNAQLAILPKCENLIAQLDCAVWDKSRRTYERTEEHAHFDAVDALIYFVRNITKQNPIPAIHPSQMTENHYIIPRQGQQHPIQQAFPKRSLFDA